MSVFLSCVAFCAAGVPSLFAAQMRYVESQGNTLNVRSGPGMEYPVVFRLPHGTKVSLQERWGLWAKITSPLETQGWVLHRYLANDPPASVEEQTDMSLGEERRRFARLQRKGVIQVQRPGDTGLLGITINPLVWRRLTPNQQQNFLRRAQRFFGGSVVEMRDQLNQELLARLSATGDFESSVEPDQKRIAPSATGAENRSETPVTPGSAQPAR